MEVNMFDIEIYFVSQQTLIIFLFFLKELCSKLRALETIFLDVHRKKKKKTGMKFILRIKKRITNFL